jgi:hypothetical protein
VVYLVLKVMIDPQAAEDKGTLDEILEEPLAVLRARRC